MCLHYFIPVHKCHQSIKWKMILDLQQQNRHSHEDISRERTNVTNHADGSNRARTAAVNYAVNTQCALAYPV